MTIPVLAMLIGLVLWLVFTKINKMSDGWVAELGRLMFFGAYLVVMYIMANKVAF